MTALPAGIWTPMAQCTLHAARRLRLRDVREEDVSAWGGGNTGMRWTLGVLDREGARRQNGLVSCSPPFPMRSETATRTTRHEVASTFAPIKHVRGRVVVRASLALPGHRDSLNAAEGFIRTLLSTQKESTLTAKTTHAKQGQKWRTFTLVQ